MNLMHELKNISEFLTYPLEKARYTYTPDEGIYVWWITDLDRNGRVIRFIDDAMMLRGRGWWIKEFRMDSDWHMSYLHDEDDVDLGPFSFNMDYDSFVRFYGALWAAEHKPDSHTVNSIGVDYRSILSEDRNHRPPQPDESIRTMNAIKYALFNGHNIDDDAQTDIINTMVRYQNDLIAILRQLNGQR